MLASHDVFSHTGPPIAKIKRGVWFVLLPAMPVSNWRDHPSPYRYWGLVFACCFIVCLLLECHCWFTLLAVVCRGKNLSRWSHSGVHGDHGQYGGYCCADLLQ